MNQQNNSLTVRILEKDYRITCPPGEQSSLRASADLLNEKIDEIRNKGAIIGGERIAIMAALNLAHELLNCREFESGYQDMDNRVNNLQKKINIALREFEVV